MKKVAIQVDKLSKQYRLGSQESYQTMRDTLTTAISAPFRRLRSAFIHTKIKQKREDDVIWALNDVSFEVKQGEVIGIIGRNGAGKSTLLKILSRITKPTTGMAAIYGRVGSLLEVGTGFHPELTGRENIYLNGAILGMRRSEIERKFDEIVTFAEIERFLDTPVKRYSSGMYVRLAFAVAAHLEPEILLVDEVLAVGDFAFRQKCLGKMSDISSGGGRTVLFVSHNMSSIQRLCQTVYLLEQGRIISGGDATTVIDTYYKLAFDRDNIMIEARDVPPGTVRCLNWQLVGSDVGDPYSCYSGDPCTFKLKFAVRRIVQKANIGVSLWTVDGVRVLAMRSLDYLGQRIFLEEGIHEMLFEIPYLPLKPGSYQLHIGLNNLGEGRLESWHAQPRLQMIPKSETDFPQKWIGILNIKGEFKYSTISNY